ncbi:MAG TPA: DMT family transporter [Blastocatellia bacterium]|nr:DMT family transporter [Blastocatellia bacterium]
MSTAESELQTDKLPEPNSLFDKLASPDLTMAFVVLIWGGNFAVLKTAYTQIAPFPFAALRFALATLLMMMLLWWKEGDVRFPQNNVGKFLWLGVVGNTIYQAMFANGLAMTTSANSSLIASTSPVAVAIAGGLIGLERITRFTVFGLALALGGISIVVGSRGAALSSRTLLGDLLVLGSVFCWAAYVLGMRTVKGHISSLRATTLTMITGTPGLVLFGLPGLVHMHRTGWTGIGIAAIFGVIYSAALALVACYLLYNRNVRLIGGVKTAIYGCIIPVVAALIAWPVLGERPTLLQTAGAALIIAGVLITRRK